jgi:hypothetical protein
MSVAVKRDPQTAPFLQAVRDLERARQRIAELEEVLDVIARKTIMDSVSAMQMRAIASAAIPRRRKHS